MPETLFDYLSIGWGGLTGFVVPFLIVLSVLVFVHEWGHYIVARMCGVKVDQFSIGFGRELFGFTDKAGTRWKFSLIPLGGYVQMFGDTDPASAYSHTMIGEGDDRRPMTQAERDVAFATKPVWKRAAIVFAGPAVNFLFAILIFAVLFATVGKPVTPPVAAGIIIGGAADDAGMQPHDRVLSINGKPVESFSDIQRQVALSLDATLDIQVLRGDETLSMTMTPRVEEVEDRFGFTHSRGMIGMVGAGMALAPESVLAVAGRDISGQDAEAKAAALRNVMGQAVVITLPGAGGETGQDIRIMPLSSVNEDGTERFMLTEQEGLEMVTHPPLRALTGAFQETYFVLTGTLKALGQMITGVRSPEELGGIIRIGAVAGDAADAGWISLISFMALLSINLGLINLFPIPLLDGGHLVFYAYEGVVRKPMPPVIMDYALRLGMVFLVALMAFANLNDIIQMIL